VKQHTRGQLTNATSNTPSVLVTAAATAAAGLTTAIAAGVADIAGGAVWLRVGAEQEQGFNGGQRKCGTRHTERQGRQRFQRLPHTPRTTTAAFSAVNITTSTATDISEAGERKICLWAAMVHGTNGSSARHVLQGLAAEGRNLGANGKTMQHCCHHLHTGLVCIVARVVQGATWCTKVSSASW